MRAVRLSRKIHKWASLIVGVQLVFWALSGFYMVAVDIDIIHGDMLVKNMNEPVGRGISQALPLGQVVKQHPGAKNITLKTVMDQPVYLVKGGEKFHLLDASTGNSLSPLNKQRAIQIAQYHYAGEGEIGSVEFVESDPPSEIKSMRLPVWRVNFNDGWGSSFYIDPDTGGFAKRRHTLWRVFDFVWMFHILDFEERENVNNNLLRVISLLGVLLGLSGIWLLFYSFKKKHVEGDGV
jgi:uncharacterized iron-regulated membrane protein